MIFRVSLTVYSLFAVRATDTVVAIVGRYGTGDSPAMSTGQPASVG